MAIGQIASIAGAIIGVALATVLVTSPNTAQIVKAFGDSFSTSISAAMGR